VSQFTNTLDTTSTRPYLIRALYEWCTDNGLTPYVAVAVDETVQVPREYVKNNEIVLNISFDATSSLKLSNDFIEFKARFAGSSREIMVPIGRVIAIYARENGQGMSFPMGAGNNVLNNDAQPPAAKPFSVVGHAPAEHSGENKVVKLVPENNTKLVTDEGGQAPDSSAESGRDDEPSPDPDKPKKSGPPALKRVK
jgi:stringent starvation protein B